ncbi:MAG: CRP-like cAMP-binding protein [Urechidicola sp.]|jgi:CRP-like cAMP-binding protein|tara:strand:+ start:5176 stop:5766 length:591 start_codon:yes stop_codon:yes gene_type:complete
MDKLIEQINKTHPLSRESWIKLNPLIEIKNYSAKEKIVEIGNRTDHFYFLFYGIVRSYEIRNSKEYSCFIFHDNNYFAAFPALITKKKSFIAIECLTECRIVSCNYYDFIKLTENSLELNILYRKILESFFISTEKREIELISLLAIDRYLTLKKRIPKIDNLISQKQIASHLGISSVQLSRLKKEQYLTKNNSPT